MATTVTCDGCGLAAEGIVEVREHDYCPRCLPAVQEFLKCVDDAHTEAAQLFAARLEELRGRFGLKRQAEGQADDNTDVNPDQPTLRELPF